MYPSPKVQNDGGYDYITLGAWPTQKSGNPEKYIANPQGGDLDSFEVNDLLLVYH